MGFGRVGGGGGGGCALHACRCLRWVRGGFVWVFSMAVFFLIDFGGKFLRGTLRLFVRKVRRLPGCGLWGCLQMDLLQVVL